MCDFTQIEYACGHFRWIASLWCSKYRQTHERCEPNVVHFDTRENECGDCLSKNRAPVPWEDLITRFRA
ncbi:hypothetical protein B0T24DRAFT_682477 [Lasiosphaeria ovina]|uniref:Uncharacterized protein n=1 Tax=Lasiosphaeria ovina TaxID=92902 RepID=A0AAE0JZP2_9PEZI|nr:hypothetical protein B0T24DRAFT_682477 [Lasiosphaeria ovina]